jgi:hypothetical protein
MFEEHGNVFSFLMAATADAAEKNARVLKMTELRMMDGRG